jgi:hypothetical protein
MPESVSVFTAEQKRKAIDRELNYRRHVYGGLVLRGKMSQKMADEQIAIFEAIRLDYAEQETAGRLL